MKVKTTNYCSLFIISVQRTDFLISLTIDFVKIVDLLKMQHLTVYPYTTKKTERKEKFGYHVKASKSHIIVKEKYQA